MPDFVLNTLLEFTKSASPPAPEKEVVIVSSKCAYNIVHYFDFVAQ